MLNIVIKKSNKSFFINSQLFSKKTAVKAVSHPLTFSGDESWLRDKVMYLRGQFPPTMSGQTKIFQCHRPFASPTLQIL